MRRRRASTAGIGSQGRVEGGRLGALRQFGSGSVRYGGSGAVTGVSTGDGGGPGNAGPGGREYLLATQEEDGGWPATTRPAGAESYAQRVATRAGPRWPCYRPWKASRPWGSSTGGQAARGTPRGGRARADKPPVAPHGSRLNSLPGSRIEPEQLRTSPRVHRAGRRQPRTVGRCCFQPDLPARVSATR